MNSRQEIHPNATMQHSAALKGDASEKEAEKIELLMNMEGITVSDRKVAVKALERAQQTGGPAAALELEDGRIITGKTSNLLGASAALLVNVLKELAGIDHNVHIISPEAIEPIQKLKVDYLNSKNPRLHTDEILIALSASAAVNPIAELALSQLPKLKGCQAHTSVMLSSVDIKTFKKLGVQLTSESCERTSDFKLKTNPYQYRKITQNLSAVSGITTCCLRGFFLHFSHFTKLFLPSFFTLLRQNHFIPSFFYVFIKKVL